MTGLFQVWVLGSQANHDRDYLKQEMKAAGQSFTGASSYSYSIFSCSFSLNHTESYEAKNKTFIFLILVLIIWKKISFLNKISFSSIKILFSNKNLISQWKSHFSIKKSHFPKNCIQVVANLHHFRSLPDKTFNMQSITCTSFSKKKSCIIFEPLLIKILINQHAVFYMIKKALELAYLGVN